MPLSLQGTTQLLMFGMQLHMAARAMGGLYQYHIQVGLYNPKRELCAASKVEDCKTSGISCKNP